MDTIWISKFVGITAGITLLRFALSGVVNSNMRHQPCVFEIFSKGLDEHKQRKMHENLWYTIWHTTRYVTFRYRMQGISPSRDETISLRPKVYLAKTY